MQWSDAGQIDSYAEHMIIKEGYHFGGSEHLHDMMSIIPDSHILQYCTPKCKHQAPTQKVLAGPHRVIYTTPPVLTSSTFNPY